MKKLLLLFFFIFLTSCSNIQFVYSDKENLINPLYNKTSVYVTGIDFVYIGSYIPVFFGNTVENNFNLEINISEKKTNVSVKKNQAASNIRYELRFAYSLISNKRECLVYEKEILSRFSVIPKSSGYDYGSEASLEQKYELAVQENLNQFLSFVSGIDTNRCK